MRGSLPFGWLREGGMESWLSFQRVWRTGHIRFRQIPVGLGTSNETRCSGIVRV